MLTEKQKALGWREGTVGEFLGMSDAEEAALEIKVGLAILLRRARDEKGLTQKQAGALIGSPQSYVAHAENAHHSVGYDYYLKLLLALGAPREAIGAAIAGEAEGELGTVPRIRVARPKSALAKSGPRRARVVV